MARANCPPRPEGMFWASGHNNNKCFVIPEWDMVVVRLGLDGKAKDEVWNGFLAKVAESLKNASIVKIDRIAVRRHRREFTRPDSAAQCVFSMNSRRGSTLSPMRMRNRSSAAEASSMVTWRRLRFSGAGRLA